MKRALLLLCIFAVFSMLAVADPIITIGSPPAGSVPIGMGPVDPTAGPNNTFVAGNVTYQGNFAFVAGYTNFYHSPWLDNTTTYVSVPTMNNPSPQTFTLSFAEPATYFGLLWGSIDSYNVMRFYDNNNLLFTLNGDGAALLAGVAANGSEDSNAFFNFLFTTPFDKIEFESTNYAIETGGFTQTPEPGTMALFGSGLATFAAFLRRRMKA